MTDYELIRYDVADKVARITLDDPTSRNALSTSLRRELVAAINRAERDDDVSVILLAGAGPVFCSGYDLRGYSPPEGGYISAQMFDRWTDQYARNCVKDWLTIWDCLKPVVCKVHGACLAGGTEVMSMCDIVFVADDARIGYPPTREMSSPDTGYFPWKMGMAHAKYMQLTGSTISGKQAADWGWVAKSFAADDFDAEVEKEVAALATIPVDMLAANKGSLNQAYEMMGFKNSLMMAIHWHTASAWNRPNAGNFGKIAAEKGIKGYIAWRDEKWTDIDYRPGKDGKPV
ncbi:enoyl-CoA hydratase [Sphingopyxis flava]|uniref:Enoyl-CoA hydratase n=2 Tax=Sphingopyxis flava TaxID=1507287 RepID=A0A1T5E556_9SPHN|nr:enoyl-CoA hydratase [Sphingopyxis flava]